MKEETENSAKKPPTVEAFFVSELACSISSSRRADGPGHSVKWRMTRRLRLEIVKAK
ncbi:hypothetical protein WM003_07760 [Klebsiella michiganensis]